VISGLRLRSGDARKVFLIISHNAKTLPLVLPWYSRSE
jgi:hypothetical protein